MSTLEGQERCGRGDPRTDPGELLVGIEAAEGGRLRKVIVVMPAYNAAKTLKMTYRDLPMTGISQVILVDDASSDDTVEVAARLGITVIRH